MPSGLPFVEICGINRFGQMVGILWDSDQTDAGEHAFLLDVQSGLQDLNDLIGAGGRAFSSWATLAALQHVPQTRHFQSLGGHHDVCAAAPDPLKEKRRTTGGATLAQHRQHFPSMSSSSHRKEIQPSENIC
jgi:hypothetical protein